MVFWNHNNNNCNILMEQSMSCFFIIVFLISYIVFYLVLKDKQKLSPLEIIKKQEKAVKYLNRYSYTDQQFFID